MLCPGTQRWTDSSSSGRPGVSLECARAYPRTVAAGWFTLQLLVGRWEKNQTWPVYKKRWNSWWSYYIILPANQIKSNQIFISILLITVTCLPCPLLETLNLDGVGKMQQRAFVRQTWTLQWSWISRNSTCSFPESIFLSGFKMSLQFISRLLPLCIKRWRTRGRRWLFQLFLDSGAYWQVSDLTLSNSSVFNFY